MVLEFDEALAVLLEYLPGSRLSRTEVVELLAARGRVLAEAVMADRDQPPFDRATRDGFAVRAEAFRAGGELTVTGQVRAGEAWAGPELGAAEAIEIMTGAPVPPGADAVVMVEHVERTGGAIRLAAGRTLKLAENIVPRAAEARAGAMLIKRGTVVGAAEIAMAAACGQARLTVYHKPRVAIVTTGDELVELDTVPGAHQIRNSNSYALAALVEAAGGEAPRQPIARDERSAVLSAINAARGEDLLVLSGGVSMGEYDLVEEALDTLGAEFFFTGVRMQPGKPVVFGRLPATPKHPAQYFFGLPGNPVSTQVTFQVFVAPMVWAMGGAGVALSPFVLATLAEDVAGKPGLTRLLPGELTGTAVRLVSWQGSGDQAANARANCFVLLPDDRTEFRASETVKVLLR